jgi:hypothetical protein
MKKRGILVFELSLIILSTAGCSQLLRPLTVKYEQCVAQNDYIPKTAEEFVTYSRMHRDKGEIRMCLRRGRRSLPAQEK